MSQRKTQLRVIADLIEATSQLAAEVARQDSVRMRGRCLGEPTLAQWAVKAGLRLEDLSEAFGFTLDDAIALDPRAFEPHVTEHATDFKIAMSVHSHVGIIALQLDAEGVNARDLSGKVSRVFAELDLLCKRGGTHLRDTMKAARDAQNMYFSEYRCPT